MGWLGRLTMKMAPTRNDPDYYIVYAICNLLYKLYHGFAELSNGGSPDSAILNMENVV